MSAPSATDVILRDGTVLMLRSPSLADCERLVTLLSSLSPSSRALRFGTAPVAVLPAAVSCLEQAGVLALTSDGEAVAHACYGDARDGRGDLGIIVADAYQGRGLGGALLRDLAARAGAAGVQVLEAFVLRHNVPMQRMLRTCGLQLRVREDFAGQTYEIRTVADTRTSSRKRFPPLVDPTTPGSALVMSRDPDRRRAWVHYMERLGARTLQCGGPQATTCALSIGNRCALHDAVDAIFYDEESVTPDLEAHLNQLPPHSPVVFARSRRDAGGRSFPVVTRISWCARSES